MSDEKMNTSIAADPKESEVAPQKVVKIEDLDIDGAVTGGIMKNQHQTAMSIIGNLR